MQRWMLWPGCSKLRRYRAVLAKQRLQHWKKCMVHSCCTVRGNRWNHLLARLGITATSPHRTAAAAPHRRLPRLPPPRPRPAPACCCCCCSGTGSTEAPSSSPPPAASIVWRASRKIIRSRTCAERVPRFCYLFLGGELCCDWRIEPEGEHQEQQKQRQLCHVPWPVGPIC